MYSNWKKTARFALALSLGACLCCAAAFVPARPAYAQISFGKMREAAEKGTPAPKAADEEDADAFDVDPNEKEPEKDAPAPRRGAAISRRGTSAASNANANATSARASDRVRAKKEQTLATNGLAEAIADADIVICNKTVMDAHSMILRTCDSTARQLYLKYSHIWKSRD